MFRFATWAIVMIVGISAVGYYNAVERPDLTMPAALRQLENDDDAAKEYRRIAFTQDAVVTSAYCLLGAFTVVCFAGPLTRLIRRMMPTPLPLIVGASLLATTGCGWKPFPPVVLEDVKPEEEGFLIPLYGDARQAGSKESIDPTQAIAEGKITAIDHKQVQILHRWLPTGYNFPYSIWANNGKWIPAQLLITVDRSPVTREWTAEKGRGTSNKDEAIWVMTADQVEFSTGWTVTARIGSKADAAKFLYNYRNRTLATVLDSEVRGQVQTAFGLEVTDLPMEKIRNDATPHIMKVVTHVKEFFRTRGIEITNLGISGGFVYKNPAIGDKIVELFNAEQEAAIAAAHAAAQEQENKKVHLAAEGRASALLTERKAEAAGIQAVADAKAYEIQKAQENRDVYLELKRLELSTKQTERWDGHWPAYFMSSGQGLNTLLQVPSPAPALTRSK